MLTPSPDSSCPAKLFARTAETDSTIATIANTGWTRPVVAAAMPTISAQSPIPELWERYAAETRWMADAHDFGDAI